MKNKIIVILAIALIFSSCEKKFDFKDYDVTLGNLFSGYGDDIEKDISFLNEKVNIKKTTLSSSSNNTLDSIDLIITTYYNYLNDIDLKSEKLNKNIFYEEDVLQEDGKLFKETSKEFLSNLNKLLKKNDLKDYLHYYFNVEDVKNKEDLYFLYMEYHYLGIPYPTFKFLIKKRKYDLMMFHNEVLSSYLIEKR